MVPSLFGQGTLTHDLRGALSELSATQRTIADRVAKATGQSANTDFAGTLQSSLDKQDEGVMRDMASMADTELRYEATTELLKKSYSDLRTAMSSNG